MSARELYNQNRVYYAEDWGVSLPPWEMLDAAGRAAWNTAALEYTVKALMDREDEDG